MRKIPLGNLNSNNPIKTSVKKYHAIPLTAPQTHPNGISHISR